MLCILGIDLAAQPVKTGVILLTSTEDGSWEASTLDGAATDDRLVEAVRHSDRVGVDAPLGWPVDFVKALNAHSDRRAWPGSVDRDRLTHRDTDRAVRSRLPGVRPLSVSADKLGITAMRCALLQHRWATEVWGVYEPRDGSGRLVETYPAAALAAWNLPREGYKGGSGAKAERGRTVRSTIMNSIAKDCAGWLDLSRVAEACIASDHLLDGLLSALVALAAGSHATVTAAETSLAITEGWIHVPSTPLAELRPMIPTAGNEHY